MKKEDIEVKIKKLQALVDNPNVSENDKKNYREGIKQYEAKLPAEKKETTAKPVAKKPTAKPVAKKPTAKTKSTPIKRKPTTTRKAKPTTGKTSVEKMPKGVTMVSKKKVMVNGVEMNTDSQEFCDYLTAEFIKRKEQAKQNKTTRKKTKSVMAQVSTKIEAGVEKAIKTGIATQKPSLAKNPNVFIGKVEKLETATKNFLQQLKEVLGNDYDAKEVTETAKAIQKLIADLKKKYNKK
jgi:uncharacterized protein (UPF0335 family)